MANTHKTVAKQDGNKQGGAFGALMKQVKLPWIDKSEAEKVIGRDLPNRYIPDHDDEAELVKAIYAAVLKEISDKGPTKGQIENVEQLLRHGAVRNRLSKLVNNAAFSGAAFLNFPLNLADEAKICDVVAALVNHEVTELNTARKEKGEAPFAEPAIRFMGVDRKTARAKHAPAVTDQRSSETPTN